MSLKLDGRSLQGPVKSSTGDCSFHHLNATTIMSDNTPKKIHVSADAEDIARIARAVSESLKAPKPKQSWFPSALNKLYKLQEAIRNIWLLPTIALFLLALIFFGADPVYPIKKWVGVSKETNAELAKYDYAQSLSKHYSALGNALLDIDEFEEAEEAFKSALECDRFSKEAEFGLVKSRLLSFSILKEFSPQVISERIRLLKKTLPRADSIDAHVAYAEARLKFETETSADTVIELLDAALHQNQCYAAAQDLLGRAYLKKRDYKRAEIYLQDACINAPYNTNYLRNYANVYELDEKIDTAYGLLKRCNRIDREIFGTMLEVLRFNTIYYPNFGYVMQTAPSIIAMFERDSLCFSPKNRDFKLTYSFGDSGDVKIKGWAAKRAYCLQLGLLARYLKGFSPGSKPMPRKTFTDGLEKIWDRAGTEKEALPALLMNDCNSFAKHNADKIGPIAGELRSICRFAQDRTAIAVVPVRF